METLILQNNDLGYYLFLYNMAMIIVNTKQLELEFEKYAGCSEMNKN